MHIIPRTKSPFSRTKLPAWKFIIASDNGLILPNWIFTLCYVCLVAYHEKTTVTSVTNQAQFNLQPVTFIQAYLEEDFAQADFMGYYVRGIMSCRVRSFDLKVDPLFISFDKNGWPTYETLFIYLLI